MGTSRGQSRSWLEPKRMFVENADGVDHCHRPIPFEVINRTARLERDALVFSVFSDLRARKGLEVLRQVPQIGFGDLPAGHVITQ